MIRAFPMAVIVVMAVVMPMAVVMVMAAVAMVVITVAVVEAWVLHRRGHLVGFEQADTQQQGQGHIPLHRPQDAGIVFDGP